MSRLEIVTIVLDGFPFLPMQLATFNRLSVDWHWSIAEGVALNVADTQWCAKIEPRLSNDGTTEFLNQLKNHPRVTVYQQKLWHGKTAMFNTMLAEIKEPCVLLEVDVDEVYQAWMLDHLFKFFSAISPGIGCPTCRPTGPNCARFFMRYFVGPNLITVGENAYGNNAGEFLRLFRFSPGMTFARHEPPFLNGVNGSMENCIPRETTRRLGIVPDHYAYVLPSQLKFKETYYQYPNALAHWQRLQEYKGPFPTKLKPFLPWTDDRAMVDTLWK